MFKHLFLKNLTFSKKIPKDTSFFDLTGRYKKKDEEKEKRDTPFDFRYPNSSQII